MSRRNFRAVWARARCEEGHALIESAIAFPVLLIVAVGLVQFALFTHAQNVVIGAVQDGARVAAAEGRTLPEGVSHAEALLRAGLGAWASEFAVSGIDAGDAVVIEARGRLRAIIPWVAD
ncbi:MAG: hypothetical protein GEU73_05765, partial [Chloroflexi bacterium]|nr:hypothetical protein [Chloroflexota bacterium]